jgi:putative methionine-R-sulfoxide reductase with GAF domain
MQSRDQRPGNQTVNVRNSLLSELNDHVSSGGMRIEALRRIAKAVRQSGGHRWVGLYDVNHDRGVVTNLVWDGPSAPAYPEFPIGNGLTGRAIASCKTVNVGNVSNDPNYLTALGSTKSEIIVPIIDPGGSVVVGTLDVESELLNAFAPETEKLLEGCAQAIRPLWTRSGER